MMICPQCGSADFDDLDIANPFDAPRLDLTGPLLRHHSRDTGYAQV